MATTNFNQMIEAVSIQSQATPQYIVQSAAAPQYTFAVKNTTVETLLSFNPKIQEAFNRNEVLLDRDLASVTPDKFGVLGHIDPTRNALTDALSAIETLRKKLSEEGSVVNEIKKLFEEIVSEDYIDQSIKSGQNSDYWNDIKSLDEVKKDGEEVKYKPRVLVKVPFMEPSATDFEFVEIYTIADISKLDAKTNNSRFYSSGLFTVGNEFRTEIRKIDGLHHALMNLQSQLARSLARKKNELIRLDNEIPLQQRKLANLNQSRLQSLAEYKMVLGLVEENWIKVERDYLKREKILTNHRGIYYARVNETPWAQSSLTDMPLRFGKLEDLVPGIALSHDELPDDIEPYIEAILDMPISNWKLFNGKWNLLPSRNTTLNLMASRKLRLQYKTQQSRTASSSKFLQTMQTHQAIMQDYLNFSLVAESSLQAFYKRAADIISLEDLLTGTPHQLRGIAQELRNKLDQATHSVLSILQSIKPSIRLDWATAAELDQLDIKNPQSWPGMSQAAYEDINSIRTLIELINWWWRQLNENATNAGITAIRNLLRAALMVAVGDDPKEMIHGQLQIIPNIFNVGDFLRANLNRQAPIGTILHLVNEKDELVGKLRVEDADENGSVVSIAQMFQVETKTAGSQYSVIGIKNTVRSFV